MKSLYLIALAALGLGACNSGSSVGGGTRSLETFHDSASYAVGRAMAASIKNQRAEVDLDLVVIGIREGMASEPSDISEETAADLVQRLAVEGRENWARELAAANIAAGDAFRAEYAAGEGVITTDSGILYEVLTEGNGPKPEPTDRVRVHYVGTLVDGTTFDSSRDRGEPADFGLDGVIPGWTQALQLMPVGSTYRIVIPPQWGYGEQGSRERIDRPGGHADLRSGAARDTVSEDCAVRRVRFRGWAQSILIGNPLGLPPLH